MKLEYAKRGLQFFFVTLVVAERRQVLSSIAELEASGQAGASGRAGRPALLPLGEIVVAALRAIHRVWPAVTISDYVVMPDHLHFLLIADYNRDQSIAPLFIAHRLADAVERAQALVEERNGRGFAPNPGRASHPGEGPDPGRAAGALAERRVEFMAGLLREAAAAACEAAPGELKVERGLRFGERRGGAGARAPVRSVVFARDCYIELSFDSRQLKAVRRYIKLNPARAIWKARHPDLFICYRAIKSERFAAFAPRRFDAIGALPILGSPFLFHVRLTLKKTVAEHEAAIEGSAAAEGRAFGALREAAAARASRPLRPLGRRQSRNRRRATRDTLGISRHPRSRLARHEARPRRLASLSAELPRDERPRRAALR